MAGKPEVDVKLCHLVHCLSAIYSLLQKKMKSHIRTLIGVLAEL